MGKNKVEKPSTCCRVCGLEQGFEPWKNDGKFPTFEICDCCGVTFGYQDCNREYTKSYRQEWLDNGGGWFMQMCKPPNWSLEDQMKNIPKEFK